MLERLQEKIEADSASNRGPNPESAQQALRQLKSRRSTRAEYNRERYPAPGQSHQRNLAPDAGTERTADETIEPKSELRVAEAGLGGAVDLSGHLRRELGCDAVVSLRGQGQPQEVELSPERHRQAAQKLGQDKAPNLGDRAEGRGQQAVRPVAQGYGGGELGSGDGGIRSSFKKLRALYDRAGETVKYRIESAIEAVQRGYGAFRHAHQDLVVASDSINRATGNTYRTVQRSSGTVERGIEGLRKVQKSLAKRRIKSRSGRDMGR